jgi:hypothetical protein
VGAQEEEQEPAGMKRLLYVLANLFAGVAIVLLLIDPTRPLTPILRLLALAVACAVLPRFVSE